MTLNPSLAQRGRFTPTLRIARNLPTKYEHMIDPVFPEVFSNWTSHPRDLIFLAKANVAMERTTQVAMTAVTQTAPILREGRVTPQWQPPHSNSGSDQLLRSRSLGRRGDGAPNGRDIQQYQTYVVPQSLTC